MTIATNMLMRHAIIATPSTKEGYSEQNTIKAANINFLIYFIGIL